VRQGLTPQSHSFLIPASSSRPSAARLCIMADTDQSEAPDPTNSALISSETVEPSDFILYRAPNTGIPSVGMSSLTIRDVELVLMRLIQLLHFQMLSLSLLVRI
jgi:hypothetical protein